MAKNKAPYAVDVRRVVKRELPNDEQARILSYLKGYVVNKDDPYNGNEIERLIKSPSVDIRRWPDVLPGAAAKIDKDSILDYLKQHAKKLAKAYYGHLIDIGYMKSYDEIRHFKNLIDLSRITTPADDFTTSGRFEYDSDDEAIFRKAGWKCLIPCFDEFVIRMNKYRYLYVHITNLNKRTKSYTLHTECYVGTPDEWCLYYKMEYKIWFLDDNSCEVPAKYKVLTSEVRSTIVSNFINEMNWSEPDITFWHDYCGVYDLNNATILRVYTTKDVDDDILNDESISMKKLRKLSFDDDSYMEVMLTNEQGIQALSRTKHMKVEIMHRGVEAMEKHIEPYTVTYLQEFFNLWVAVWENLTFRDEVKETETSLIIDKMIVKTPDMDMIRNWDTSTVEEYLR